MNYRTLLLSWLLLVIAADAARAEQDRPIRWYAQQSPMANLSRHPDRVATYHKQAVRVEEPPASSALQWQPYSPTEDRGQAAAGTIPKLDSEISQHQVRTAVSRASAESAGHRMVTARQDGATQNAPPFERSSDANREVDTSPSQVQSRAPRIAFPTYVADNRASAIAALPYPESWSEPSDYQWPLSGMTPDLMSGESSFSRFDRFLRPLPAECRRGLVFGEFLYLRPGNDKIRYAVPVDGAIVPPLGAPYVQIGSEASVDVDFSPGFRVGWEKSILPSSFVRLSYTRYKGSDRHSVAIDPPVVLHSLVSHPGAAVAPEVFLNGSATAELNYQLADIEAATEIVRDDTSAVYGSLALRYADLDQRFSSIMTNVFLAETVAAAIDFNGLGLRLGCEATQQIFGVCRSSDVAASPYCEVDPPTARVEMYGKFGGSLLAGEFQTSYRQVDNFNGLVARTGWEDDRIIPILDMELGLAWTGPRERLRISAGYFFNVWYNTVTPESFIHGVRRNYSGDITNSLTLDGFTVKGECRY